MSFLRRPRFFVLLALLAPACGTGGGKTALTSGDIKAKTGKSNSYYHYLLAQISSFNRDDKAVQKHLSDALELDPESGFLWNQKAYLEAKLGNVAEAEKSAETSLAKDPANADTLLLLGKVATVKNKPQTAVGLYRRALALDPKNEEAYNLLARDLYAAGDKPDSLAALRSCLKVLPEATSCMYYLASLHFDAGRWDEALRYFSMILAYNPDQPRVLNAVGEIHLKKGRYEKALEVFRQLRDQNPHDIVSQIRVGLLYYQTKDLDAAIKEFTRVGKRFPRADKVNYFLGLMLMEKGRIEEAFDRFNRVPDSSAFFKDAMSRQLAILKEVRDVDQAVKLVERKFSPKAVESYQIKTSLFVTAERFGEALETATTGLKKFKNDERLLFQRAVVHDKLGDWKKARRDLEAVIRINPESADAYNYLGYTLADRGEDLETALRYVEKALALTPDEGHVLDSLGWVYFKMNRLDKALKLLTRAAKLTPDEPTIMEHVGDVYAQLKDQRRAREYYRKSLALLRAAPGQKGEDLRQIEAIERKLAEV